MILGINCEDVGKRCLLHLAQRIVPMLMREQFLTLSRDQHSDLTTTSRIHH